MLLPPDGQEDRGWGAVMPVRRPSGGPAMISGSSFTLNRLPGLTDATSTMNGDCVALPLNGVSAARGAG